MFFSRYDANALLSAYLFVCSWVERWQKVHSFASFGICTGFVQFVNVCTCARLYCCVA
jgi:hypothetical protein